MQIVGHFPGQTTTGTYLFGVGPELAAPRLDRVVQLLFGLTRGDYTAQRCRKQSEVLVALPGIHHSLFGQLLLRPRISPIATLFAVGQHFAHDGCSRSNPDGNSSSGYDVGAASTEGRVSLAESPQPTEVRDDASEK